MNELDLIPIWTTADVVPTALAAAEHETEIGEAVSE